MEHLPAVHRDLGVQVLRVPARAEKRKEKRRSATQCERRKWCVLSVRVVVMGAVTTVEVESVVVVVLCCGGGSGVCVCVCVYGRGGIRTTWQS